MAERRQFCTFFLDELYFGIEVERVQEVMRFHGMTRTPLAPAVVRGLINLRGQIVTAIDLRRKLELEERAPDREPMNVVVRREGGAVSFLVDEIGGVVDVDEDAYSPVPETLTGPARELIAGAYRLEGRLLLRLNTDRALALVV